jgi:inosine-uridine nucleoside N-ribohydrolase
MPIAVIIDTDPGTDDAIALFMALAAPALDVRLITATGGNVGLAHTLANARSLVGMAGADVPVVAGADRALLGSFTSETKVHGGNGMGGLVLPEGPPATPGLAADAIRAALRAAPEAGLTLVGVGPATNLALALASEPALLGRIAEIVLMTGAWGEGNVTPAAEFNAWSDPEALQIVLSCGRPVTLVTLELTAQALCTPARIAALREAARQSGGEGACLRTACAILDSVPLSRRFAGLGHPQHDACTIAWLLTPELFTSREVYAEVDLGPGPSRGRTVIDRWGRLGRPANARLLETLDAEGFFALLTRSLLVLP